MCLTYLIYWKRKTFLKIQRWELVADLLFRSEKYVTIEPLLFLKISIYFYFHCLLIWKYLK